MVVIYLKESLMDSISKILDKTKALINKTERNIKFESNKSHIIKTFFNPLLEKKEEEKNRLSRELKKIKEEHNQLKNQIRKKEAEKALYDKKIDALIKFQHFILEHQ
jgi:sugar-specific transcriptional regulator TrmB